MAQHAAAGRGHDPEFTAVELILGVAIRADLVHIRGIGGEHRHITVGVAGLAVATCRYFVMAMRVVAGQALIRMEGRLVLKELALLVTGFAAVAVRHAPGMLWVAVAAVPVLPRHVLELQPSGIFPVAGDAGPVATDAEVIQVMAVLAVIVGR